MTERMEAALARIYRGDAVVGAGLLVTPRYIVTCAHVVAAALNLRGDLTQIPTDPIRLDFPLAAQGAVPITARVVLWQPPQSDGGGDIAGLEVIDALPAGVASEGLLTASYLWNHPFRAFGFSAKHDAGVWAEGHIQGRQSYGWVQVVCGDGYLIEPGFSGTPVWDTEHNGVVGIAVAAETAASAGYIIPTKTLIGAWPILSQSTVTPFHADGDYYFISYSHANKTVVERLIADLAQHGINIWIDKQGLKAGTRNWEQALRDAISGSKAVLLAASPDSRRSNYVQDELSIAEMYNRPLYPVWAAGEQWIDCIPMGLGKMQYIDVRTGNYDNGVREMVEALKTLTGPTAASSQPIVPTPAPMPLPTFAPRNPYKGLRAFDRDDQRDFFGRDGLIQILIAHVEHARFLAIIGASGSGKSSVVKAGLLPTLQATHRDWIFSPEMVPGTNPIERLSLALFEQFGGSVADIRKDLDTLPGSRGLHLRVSPFAKKPGARVILFIDQFEELFTLTTDEDERQRFIDLLTTAVTEPDGALTVILTMRADFGDRPMAFTDLLHLFDVNRQSIPPLSLTDIRDVIEKPVALDDVQMTFEDGLVAELVFDVRDQVGALPLLQFTLDQLFEKCRDNPDRRLTFAAYREIGGLHGALTKHAEATYAILPSDEHRTLTRALFLRLIEPGTTEQDTTRRRAALSELDLPDPLQSAIMHECRDRFIAARLLTTNDLAGVTTIEVSHETLIREWTRLGDWLQNARGDLGLQKQISQDAAAWVARGRSRDDDGLYRGLVLINAQDWAKRNVASVGEQRFIDASMARQTTVGMADKKRQRELINTQRGAAFMALMALIWIFVSIRTSANAQQSVDVANTQVGVALTQTLAPIAVQVQNDKNLSESLRLASLASGVLASGTGDANVSVLLSIRGLQTAYSTQADAALVKALDAPRAKLAFSGHTSTVMSVAFSPDGRYALTGSGDGTARLWDVASGQTVRTFSGHTDRVYSVAFSPDGRFILTGSYDKTARLWDIASGQTVRTFSGHTAAVRSVAFSSDGRFILTGSYDKTARLWDIASGQTVRTFSGHTDRVYSVAFSPDGRYALTGSGDGTARLWDIASGQTVRTFSGHTNPVLSVAFSPDGRYALTGSGDGTARLWDIASGQTVRTLSGHTNPVLSVAFSPDGRYALTGSEDDTARLWDIASGQTVRTLSGHMNRVYSVAFSPDGRYALTGSEDDTARLWDVVSSQAVRTFSGHTHGVQSVAFSPNGRYTLTGSDDSTARLWDVTSGQIVRTFSGHTDVVPSVVFSPDGRFALTGSADNTTRLWDVANGQAVHTFRGHTDAVNSVAFSPDGRYALTGSYDKTARLWDIASGQTVRTFSGHIDGVTSVAFSPDGRYALTGSYDKTARLWDIVSGQTVRTFSGHIDGVTSVAFSPDGRYALTGSYDKTVRLWEVANGQTVRTFSGHMDVVTSVAFSPDGRYALTGSYDKTARLWDVANGQTVRTFSGHTAGVQSIAFSADGRFILTGSWDNTARLWDVDYHDFIAYACTQVYRNFTDDERTLYGIQDNVATCPQFDPSHTATPVPTATSITETWTPVPTHSIPALSTFAPLTPQPTFTPTITDTPHPTGSPTPTVTLQLTLIPITQFWTPIASPTISDTPSPTYDPTQISPTPTATNTRGPSPTTPPSATLMITSRNTPLPTLTPITETPTVTLQ